MEDLKVLNNSRAEFERWFKNHYRVGREAISNPLDYSLAKDGTGRYLCLHAAIAWRAWCAARGES